MAVENGFLVGEPHKQFTEKYILSQKWTAKAECKGSAELFYAVSGESQEEKLSREYRALQFCGQCSVRAECLEYAVIGNEQHGIWGGVPEDDLKKTIRRMRSLR